jgi:hypothetical protein
VKAVKTKPHIDALLEAGATAKPNPDQGSAATPAPEEFRKQMVMQLPVALINDLQRRALDLSVSSGKRVTQQQLVEEALRKYLYKCI